MGHTGTGLEAAWQMGAGLLILGASTFEKAP